MPDTVPGQIPCPDCDEHVTISADYKGELSATRCPNGHRVVYFGPSGRKSPVCPRSDCKKNVTVHVSKEGVMIRSTTTGKSIRPYPVKKITCDKHGPLPLDEFFPKSS